MVPGFQLPARSVAMLLPASMLGGIVGGSSSKVGREHWSFVDELQVQAVPSGEKQLLVALLGVICILL